MLTTVEATGGSSLEVVAGPTFRWVGAVIALLQAPLAATTVMLAMRECLAWRPPSAAGLLLVCAPLLLAVCGLVVATAAARSSASLAARLAWGVALACVAAFLLLLLARLEGAPGVAAFWPFVPHWGLALAGAGLGAGLLLRSRRRRRVAEGVLALVASALWGSLALLAFLRVSGAARQLSWAAVFVPWFAADGFLFIAFGMMLVFSFGASGSALLTIPQQLLVMLLSATSTVLKALLATLLDRRAAAGSAASSNSSSSDDSVDAALLFGVFLSAMLAELLLFAMGASLMFSRNSSYVLCGRFAGGPVPESLQETLSAAMAIPQQQQQQQQRRRLSAGATTATTPLVHTPATRYSVNASAHS